MKVKATDSATDLKMIHRGKCSLYTVMKALQCVETHSLSFTSRRSTPATLQSYASDVCLFLFRALEDGFHDIKKAACACICTLAARAPASAIEPHAEKLLQVGYPVKLEFRSRRVDVTAMEKLVL